MRLGFIFLLLISFCLQVNAQGNNTPNQLFAKAPPKNIILLIGDGMGPAHLAAYRHFKDNLQTDLIETTIFDELFLGTMSTDPDAGSGTVTDSAAAATAFSTGKKTYNGAISYDSMKKPLTPLFERAVNQGKVTGVVVTSQVNHATPAAFAASALDREEYSKIAYQYANRLVNGRPLMEVILGGGVSYFKNDELDLLKEFKKKGFQVSTDPTTFEQLSSASPMIGLYGKKGMASYLERSQSLITLPNFMRKALARLEKNPKGFVLLVEGSQIDWASHGNNILDALWEMDEFAQAVKEAVGYAEIHDDTLVLVTADHETGGLSLGRDGEYQWLPNKLKSAQSSLMEMLNQYKKGEGWKDIFKKQGISLTQKQLAKAPENGAKDKKIHRFMTDIYNQNTVTGWTTSGHTGVDVWLMGMGAGSEKFKGHWSNDKVGKELIDMISIDKKSVSDKL